MLQSMNKEATMPQSIYLPFSQWPVTDAARSLLPDAFAFVDGAGADSHRDTLYQLTLDYLGSDMSFDAECVLMDGVRALALAVRGPVH